VGQGTREPRFPNAGGARDEHIVPIMNPLAGGQAEHERFIEPARVTIVNILNAGTQPQLGLSQASREPPVTSDGHLAIDQEAQTFFETERLALRQVHLLAERFGHAREPQRQEFVESRMIQPSGSPVWVW
jgi:hypothetical protein